MSELKFLVNAAAHLRETREPFLVATVVRVRGSSYRRPGARMLITRDRWLAGSVSGGCLEGDVIKKAWWRTEQGPALVTYDMQSDDEIRAGFGLGCDGVVDVLLERAEEGRQVDPLGFFARCVESQQRGALATVFRTSARRVPLGTRVLFSGGRTSSDVPDPRVGDRLFKACSAVLASEDPMEVTCTLGGGESVDAFVEPVRPPARVFIFGAGHDAVPVAEIAGSWGGK